MNQNETMGQRIAALRKARQMTQDALAQELGVSPQAVSKWEHDLSCPDIALLPKLAKTLGVSTDYLLGGGTSAAPTQPELRGCFSCPREPAALFWRKLPVEKILC